MKRIASLALSLTLLLFPLPGLAWEEFCEGVSVDRTVHDFGDITLGSGPVSCTFTLRNDSPKPWLIDRVTTSCGCTSVKWSTQAVPPGGTGSISLAYKNDEGAFPFDKSASVWLSCNDRPAVLRIRGVCHDKPIVLEEIYGESIGAGLAVKSLDVNGGVLEQGGQRSECFLIANLSGRPAVLDFDRLPAQVKVRNLPLTVPARQTVRIDFCVSGDASLWGKNLYSLYPVIDGQKSDKPVRIRAVTQMNTSRLTKEEKRAGPRISFTTSTRALGKIRQDARPEVHFDFTNNGKAPLQIYKIDAEEGVAAYDIQVQGAGRSSDAGSPSYPVLQPGESATLRVKIDMKTLPKGEMLLMLRLITNSPLRPMADVFISAWIE